MVFNKRRVKYNMPNHIRFVTLLLREIDLDTTKYLFIYILYFYKLLFLFLRTIDIFVNVFYAFNQT